MTNTTISASSNSSSNLTGDSPLITAIRRDHLEARRNKDRELVDILSLILSRLLDKQRECQASDIPMDRTVEHLVLASCHKKCVKAIAIYEKAGQRPTKQLTEELSILEHYLDLVSKREDSSKDSSPNSESSSAKPENSSPLVEAPN